MPKIGIVGGIWILPANAELEGVAFGWVAERRVGCPRRLDPHTSGGAKMGLRYGDDARLYQAKTRRECASCSVVARGVSKNAHGQNGTHAMSSEWRRDAVQRHYTRE